MKAHLPPFDTVDRGEYDVAGVVDLEMSGRKDYWECRWKNAQEELDKLRNENYRLLKELAVAGREENVRLRNELNEAGGEDGWTVTRGVPGA